MFRNLASTTLAVLMISGPAFAQRGAVARPEVRTETRDDKRDEGKGKGTSVESKTRSEQRARALVTVESHASEIVKIARAANDAETLALAEGLEGAVRNRDKNGLKDTMKDPVNAVEMTYKKIKTDHVPVKAALNDTIKTQAIDKDALVECK